MAKEKLMPVHVGDPEGETPDFLYNRPTASGLPKTTFPASGIPEGVQMLIGREVNQIVVETDPDQTQEIVGTPTIYRVVFDVDPRTNEPIQATHETYTRQTTGKWYKSDQWTDTPIGSSSTWVSSTRKIWGNAATQFEDTRRTFEASLPRPPRLI